MAGIVWHLGYSRVENESRTKANDCTSGRNCFRKKKLMLMENDDKNIGLIVRAKERVSVFCFPLFQEFKIIPKLLPICLA